MTAIGFVLLCIGGFVTLLVVAYEHKYKKDIGYERLIGTLIICGLTFLVSGIASYLWHHMP